MKRYIRNSTNSRKVLYHTVFNKATYDYVIRNGITTDDSGWVYLAEKPFDTSHAYAVFRVRIPDESLLHDWREFWCDEDGNEIDFDHVYDPDNPYYMYNDDIPLSYIEEV